MYLILKEELLANNSQVLISEIGKGDNEALLCITDFHNFNNNINDNLEVGNWYFPNKSLVETSGDIYISRERGVVRLHRTKNVTTPTGMFRCEIPDANGTFQNIIVDINVQPETTVTMVYPSSPNLLGISAGVVVSELLLIAVVIVLVITLCGIKTYRRRTVPLKCTEATPNTADGFEMKQNEIYIMKSELKLNNNTSYGVAPWRSNQRPPENNNNQINDDNVDTHIYEHIIN